MTIPFCKDCKHLIGKRHMTEHAEGWKCGHPSNIQEEVVDAVIGETRKKFILLNCAASRTGYPATCGPEGKLFELYVQPIPTAMFFKPKPQADDLLNELEGLK